MLRLESCDDRSRMVTAEVEAESRLSAAERHVGDVYPWTVEIGTANATFAVIDPRQQHVRAGEEGDVEGAQRPCEIDLVGCTRRLLVLSRHQMSRIDGSGRDEDIVDPGAELGRHDALSRGSYLL